MQKKYCFKCGTPSVNLSANFCSSCGTSFAGTSQKNEKNLPSSNIEEDEDGPINLSLANQTKKIDFDILVPFDNPKEESLRSLIKQSEK